eukprot:1160029-Pelagomonas_calceolata.AAC.6
MEEWGRRPKAGIGLSTLPIACMAGHAYINYQLDHETDDIEAGECRKPDDIEANLVKAMKAAVTDGARARIVSVLRASHVCIKDISMKDSSLSEQATQELLGTDAAGTQAGPGSLAGSKSTLVVLRLDPEDIGVRPLPVLGAYGERKLHCNSSAETVATPEGEATLAREFVRDDFCRLLWRIWRQAMCRAHFVSCAAVEDLEAAPRASQEGTFGAFTIASGQGSSSWVVSEM